MKRRTEAGFALGEALVALAILVGGIVGILHLVTSSMRANQSAQSLTVATNLALSKVEELRSLEPSSVASGADAHPLGENGSPGGIYTRSWNAGTGPISGTKEVTVSVTWIDGGARRVDLRTVL